MVKKTIAIIGTLDTKGEEFAFLKQEIEKQGCATFVINVGVLGEPPWEPDISADEVAQAGGSTLEQLISTHDRGQAVDVMCRGVAKIVEDIHKTSPFHGIISMGGGGGTALGTAAMRVLPVNVPKLMVSTVASGDTSPYVGTTNITMMPSIVDVSGLNSISRRIFVNAAGAISGMAKAEVEGAKETKPLIAASMFGNTTRAVDHARHLLEAHGFEVLVFHATGTGGRTMEMLIEDGYFAGVLDMTTTELVDELCGGVLSAGKTRLDAAALKGVPQVVVPGCLDMCNFWAPKTVPEKYKDRKFITWNENVTLMRTTPEENQELGKIFAEKMNKAEGPVAVVIPTKGFSEVDMEGGQFWWPEANQAFVDSLRENIKPSIPVLLIDKNVNDPEFSKTTAERLLDFVKGAK